MAIPWSGWERLGKPQETELSRPFAQRNQDGRIEVFASGQGRIFHAWQVFPNSGWSDGWLGMGSPAPDVHVEAHVVGRNADGRQEVFALGDDGALWQAWQVAPNGGWSGWRRLGAPGNGTSLAQEFEAGRNQDGRQELFAVGTDGHVWQIWQTAPGGGWSTWKDLGAPGPGIRPDRISVGNNGDGRQELFVMGKDAAVWHVWQLVPNAGWGDWSTLDKPADRDLSEPLVQTNADGHLEVFAPGNGAFCNRWQEAPNSNVWRHEGWNEKPRPRPDIGLTWLDAALNPNQRLEVIGFGDDGAVWHAWQVDVPPFWSEWQSLGAPPARIRAADRLTIGRNEDGRLEVFVVGEDGAVWHAWQVR